MSKRVDLVVEPRAHTSGHAVKTDKARFDGSDMFFAGLGRIK